MNLKDIIRKGRATAELLPRIFSEEEDIPEELRLQALNSTARTNPVAAKPYYSRLNDERLADAISRHQLAPEFINLAIRIFPSSEKLIEAVIGSPRSPTRALTQVSSKATSEQINRLTKDEYRLILAPDLISSLLARKDIDQLLRSKLEDLLQKINRDKQFQIRAGFRPEEMTSEDRKLLVAESNKDEPLDEDKKTNIYAKLITMTAAEKAMLALFANKNTRMMLAKDPNTLVARAVMKSPRLTEQDIEQMAKTREISDEVLRLIAQNRRWMRKYVIMKNLALNPRTPLTLSMNILPRLSNNDLRSAVKDHNLASAVKQALQRLVRSRGLR